MNHLHIKNNHRKSSYDISEPLKMYSRVFLTFSQVYNISPMPTNGSAHDYIFSTLLNSQFISLESLVLLPLSYLLST